MKTTTKLMAVTLVMLAIFFTANAQSQTSTTAQPSPWRLGIGLEAGIPTGNATDISNFLVGGTLRLEYAASKDVAVMLTAGYYDMLGKTVANSSVKYPSLTMVPVKAGVKYFVAPGFYIDVEGGLGFDTSYEDHVKLIVSPGLGYDGTTWDVGLRYENYSGQNNSFGQIGLRLAYNFGL